MERSGRRRNKKQWPFRRSTSEDIILNHYGESTFQRAMVLEGPFRFLPCEIEPCKLCTCWPSIRSLRQWLTRTPTDFDEAAQPQMRWKLASLHSVELIGRNGFSKGISVLASTKSLMSGSWPIFQWKRAFSR